LIKADVPENVLDIYRRDGYFTNEKSTGTTFGVEMIERRVIYETIPLNQRTFDLFNMFGKTLNDPAFREKRVLEIGPSPNGGTIRYLTGLTVVDGLEISEYASDYLENIGFSMYCGNIDTLQIDKKYDIILAYEVVEHFGDPKASFSGIFNHLAAGGVFIFSTGNSKSLRAIFSGAKWDYFLPPQHLFYYSGRTITRYLEQAGFKKSSIKICKYSLWGKRQAIKLGFPGPVSRIFLGLIRNLTSGMTVYAKK
jgi:SAM-dependent methyltransferase